MKKGACIFCVLLLTISTTFSGCSPELLSQLSGAKAVPQLTVDVNLTNKTEDKVFIQTAVPVFGGFDSAKILNARVQELVDQGINEVKEAEKELEKNPDRPPVLLFFQSFFDYSENGDILSVWNTFSNYTGGAHGLSWIRSFTVNRKTGEFYDTLGSIFQNEAEGKKLITDKIIAEIRKKPDLYFPDAEKTVRDKNGDFLYYIDGSNLVVYFDLYEIAPYVAGIPTFAFPLKDLKTKVESMGNPAGSVRKNGRNWSFAHPAVSNDSGEFLPLEDMANAMNHSVEYKDGKYTVDGKSVQPVMINSVAYVPLQFFREDLGDFIIFDGTVLRMFTQSDGVIEKNSSSGAAISENSAAEKPIRKQMGYIKSMDAKTGTVVIDPVEWLTTKDEARLKELKIDPESLLDNYYIYNPSKLTESLKLTDQTKYYRIDLTGSASGVASTDLTGVEEKLKNVGMETYPYQLLIDGDKVVEMKEQYVP